MAMAAPSSPAVLNGVPLTQNTAPVLEYTCLFTSDIRRKAKRWSDGRLRFHTFNKRVMVYDERSNFVGDTHWRDAELDEGEELELDRGGVLVQVGSCTEQKSVDVSGLFVKRLKEREERAQMMAQRSQGMRSRMGTQGFAPPTPIRPPAAMVAAQPTVETPAPKRRKVDDTDRPSKSTYAQSLTGVSLNLSAGSYWDKRTHPEPLWARTSRRIEQHAAAVPQVPRSPEPARQRHGSSLNRQVAQTSPPQQIPRQRHHSPILMSSSPLQPDQGIMVTARHPQPVQDDHAARLQSEIHDRTRREREELERRLRELDEREAALRLWEQKDQQEKAKQEEKRRREEQERQDKAKQDEEKRQKQKQRELEAREAARKVKEQRDQEQREAAERERIRLETARREEEQRQAELQEKQRQEQAQRERQRQERAQRERERKEKELRERAEREALQKEAEMKEKQEREKPERERRDEEEKERLLKIAEKTEQLRQQELTKKEQEAQTQRAEQQRQRDDQEKENQLPISKGTSPDTTDREPGNGGFLDIDELMATTPAEQPQTIPERPTSILRLKSKPRSKMMHLSMGNGAPCDDSSTSSAFQSGLELLSSRSTGRTRRTLTTQTSDMQPASGTEAEVTQLLDTTTSRRTRSTPNDVSLPGSIEEPAPRPVVSRFASKKTKSREIIGFKIPSGDLDIMGSIRAMRNATMGGTGGLTTAVLGGQPNETGAAEPHAPHRVPATDASRATAATAHHASVHNLQQVAGTATCQTSGPWTSEALDLFAWRPPGW